METNGESSALMNSHTSCKAVISCSKQPDYGIKNGSVASKVAASSSSPSSYIASDGGFRAWLVVLASATVNGTIFGVVNSFGVLYYYLIEMFKNAAEQDADFVKPLIGKI